MLQNVGDICFAAASPNTIYFHDYDKEAVTFYMEAWTWEELQKVHKIPGGPLAEGSLSEMYHHFYKIWRRASGYGAKPTRSRKL